MGAQKQPAYTTQVQKVELPAWVDQASQSNYAEADRIGNKPYEAYTGQRIAGMTDMERGAGSTLQNGIDRSNTNLDLATMSAAAGAGYRPRMVSSPTGVNDVTAQSFLSRDIGAYMDPNLDNVVNRTTDNMRRDITLGTQGISDDARNAGAWGSSRQGVREAVYQAEGAKKIGDTEASLRSAAFQDAANRLQQDNVTALQAALANQQSGLTTQGQRLQAETANQGAGLTAAGLRLQAGQLANQTAQTASDTAGRNSILQSQLGAQERAYNQSLLDQQYQDWSDAKNYDTEALNLKLAALGMSPYGKSTSTTGTSKSESSSNPWMTGIGAAATILPLLFSDRDTKKDIKRIGKVEGTDLNKYEFKYKKGFMGRDTPKMVGLMADDVKKKVPGAVKSVDVNGKKVDAVDYGVAIAGAPRQPREDKGKVRGVYRPRGIGIGSRLRAA